MSLPGIQANGATPIDQPKQQQKPAESEMTLSEFRTSIFNKYGDNLVANDKKTVLKSDGKIEQFFNSNDTNGVYGLNAQERSKATADVNAYIQNAYSVSVSDRAAKQAEINKEVASFNSMNEEQQVAAMKQEIADIIAAGQDVSCSGDGKLKIGGETIDLKQMGLSDDAIKTIEAEVQKHQAEVANKNDE